MPGVPGGSSMGTAPGRHKKTVRRQSAVRTTAPGRLCVFPRQAASVRLLPEGKQKGQSNPSNTQICVFMEGNYVRQEYRYTC